MVRPKLLAAAAMTVGGSALQFTVFNGQIFTPGFAIVDAPQPGTPEGGDFLQVALDISADGKLPQPPYDPSSPSQIWNITMFLSSYATGRNFTISNGTATANNGSLGEIMAQEPGSTVKHVNWVWPDCLVGDGQPSTPNSDRGVYNISIRQNFRLNGKDHYTIFDLPISVTNSIPDQFGRVPCDSINNPLLTPEQINATAANDVGILFAPGDNTTVEVSPNGSDGLGGNKPGATPSTGLGGAGTVSWKTAAYWLTVVAIAVSVLA